MFDSISPASTRKKLSWTADAFAGSLVRRLLFVLRTSKGSGPSPSVLILGWTAFPSSDYDALSATS